MRPAMKMHAVTGRRRPDKGEDSCRRGERGPRLSTVRRAGRFGEAELSEDHANDNRSCTAAGHGVGHVSLVTRPGIP